MAGFELAIQIGGKKKKLVEKSVGTRNEKRETKGMPGFLDLHDEGAVT